MKELIIAIVILVIMLGPWYLAEEYQENNKFTLALIFLGLALTGFLSFLFSVY